MCYTTSWKLSTAREIDEKFISLLWFTFCFHRFRRGVNYSFEGRTEFGIFLEFLGNLMDFIDFFRILLNFSSKVYEIFSESLAPRISTKRVHQLEFVLFQFPKKNATSPAPVQRSQGKCGMKLFRWITHSKVSDWC